MGDLAFVAMDWDSADRILVSSPGTGLLLSFSVAKHCDLKQSHKIQSHPKTAALSEAVNRFKMKVSGLFSG